jgi:hypothetical protein
MLSKSSLVTKDLSKRVGSALQIPPNYLTQHMGRKKGEEVIALINGDIEGEWRAKSRTSYQRERRKRPLGGSKRRRGKKNDVANLESRKWIKGERL